MPATANTTQSPIYLGDAITTVECKILNGATLSNAIDVYGTSIVGIYVPINFVGDFLFFHVLMEDGFKKVYAPSSVEVKEMKLKVTADRMFCFVPSDFAAFKQIKIESSSAQTSDITFKLITRVLA